MAEAAASDQRASASPEVAAPLLSPPSHPSAAVHKVLPTLWTSIVDHTASSDEGEAWVEHAEVPPSPVNSPTDPQAHDEAGDAVDVQAFSLSLCGRLARVRSKRGADKGVQEEETAVGSGE